MIARAERLVLITLAVMLVLAAARLTVWRLDAEGDLQLATSLLVEGDPDEAARLVAPMLDRPSVGPRARGVSAFADLLRGMDNDEVVNAAARALAEEPIRGRRLILWRLLRERRAESLAALLSRSTPEVRDRHRELEALARLELGELVLPASASTDLELPARLGEIVQRRQRGDLGMVFDRGGRLIGSIDDDGAIDLSDEASALQFESWIERVVDVDHPPAGLRLALDLELSARARRALGRYRGSVVVLDVHTGEVLAVATDGRTIGSEGPAFLDQLREPASISKLITAAAGLRAGYDLDAEFQSRQCQGSVAVEDGHVWCPVVAGRLRGLDQALAWSCNTSFGRLGLQVGGEALVAEYRRFGFSPDPGSGSGAELVLRDGSRRWLAELAIGLERAALTPLHAARMAAVFGNGGSLVEPRWIVGTDGYLGLTPMRSPARRTGPPILEPAVAARIEKAMEAVISDGTARGVEPAGFPVAMKTGTASEYGKGFHVNYIGVGPLPAPRYAFAVRITHQRTSKDVRYAARQVTSRFLRSLAAWAGSAGSPPLTESPPRRSSTLAGGG